MQQMETWQVEVEGKIYETDFAGLTQWIAESSLLPNDKVRRGNLRWVEAKLVPALNPYFGGKAPLVSEGLSGNGMNYDPAAPQDQKINATVNYSAPKNFGSTAPNTPPEFSVQHQAAAVVETFAKAEIFPDALPEIKPAGLEIFSPDPAPLPEQATEPFPIQIPEQVTGPIPAHIPEQAPPAVQPEQDQPAKAAVKSTLDCGIHPDREASFACRQCLSLFCEECPRSISKVRICPRCGDMCQPYGAGKTIKTSLSGKPVKVVMAVDPVFTFNDFLAAWAYPLKFPLALLIGGVIGAALSFGMYFGMASVMFGGFLSGGMAVLICAVLSTAFVFGCTSNAVRQVAYGKTDETFLSNGEDFSVWDSILLPCLLGVGTYLVAFGPAMIVLMMFIRTLPAMPDALQEQIRSAGSPNQRRTAQQAAKPDPGKISPAEWQAMIESSGKEDQAESAKKIEELIKTSQVSPAIDPAASALSPEQMMESYVNRLMGRIVPFVIMMGLALLWGLFFFPMALTVAGFTQSIGSTLNPLVGLETIKLMGANYFKAFGTYLLLLIASLAVYGCVMVVMIPLSMFSIGPIIGQVLVSAVSFYLYLVIAFIFGTALYRSHEKLGFSVN